MLPSVFPKKKFFSHDDKMHLAPRILITLPEGASLDNTRINLKAGQINTITSDDCILKRYSIDDNNVILLQKRYSSEPYGIAFKKGPTTKKLKENIDFAIKDMKFNGKLSQLHKKWNL